MDAATASLLQGVDRSAGIATTAPPEVPAAKPQGAQGAVFAMPQQAQAQPAQAQRAAFAGPVAKAGFVAKGKTEQSSQLPDYVKAGIVDSTQKDIAAVNFEAQVQANQAVEQYGIQQQAQAQMQQMQAQEQLREQKRQERVQSQMQKVQDVSTDAAAGKIDRGHIWANGGREAAVMAMALGAFAAAMPGGNGQNTALKVIDKAVDDDLKEQEANLAQKNKNAAQQQNVLSAMRENFGDERAAYSAAKAIKLQDAAQQIEVNAAKYKAPMVQANAAKTVEAMRQKAYALFGEAEKTATATSYAFSAGGTGGPPGSVGPTPAAVAKDAAAYGDDVEKAKLNEAESSLANVNGVLKKYEGKGEIPGIQPENFLKRGIKGAADFVAGSGSGEKLFYSPEERGNRQTLEYVKADLRHALTGSGMSESERANLDNMIQSAQGYADIAKTRQIIQARVDYHKANIAGGHSPEAVDLFNQRSKAAHGSTDRKIGPSIKPAGE